MIYKKIFYPEGKRCEFTYGECEELIQDISDFADEHLKEKHPECYHHLEEVVDDFLLGPHFNEERLKIALQELVRRDGSKGGFWILEQTNDLASQGRLYFTDDFNQYDFCYSMNFVRAKYSEFVQSTLGSDNVKHYFELAKSFQPSKSTPAGSPWHIYVSLYKMSKEDH